MKVGAAGRSLELFFIDGKPDGMLTAEVFNWTGHILMAPRTRITAALARREATYAGAYILIGEKEGVTTAYIGEGDDVSLRIKSHDTKKDWWTRVVFITSGTNGLNKAHVQYLEARLIGIAKSVARVSLDNGNFPGIPTLSEAAISNMEGYLEYLLMVLPALGVDLFVERTVPPRTATASVTSAAPRFELESPKHSLKAQARLEDGDFIVEVGSQARASWEGRTHTTYAPLHKELVDAGKLVLDGSFRRFRDSYAFKSPSAAAAVVLGRPANGQTEWKLEGTPKTYKEWEAEQLARSGVSET